MTTWDLIESFEPTDNPKDLLDRIDHLFGDEKTITVIFKDKPLKLHLFRQTDPIEQYIVYYGEDRDNDSACMRIYFKENEIPYLSWIANHASCNLPSFGKSCEKGGFIVQLANAFICALGFRKAYLEDNAVVSCGNSDLKYSLLLFRILTNKFSWYETFGYFPKISHGDMQLLKDYPIDLLILQMSNILTKSEAILEFLEGKNPDITSVKRFSPDNPSRLIELQPRDRSLLQEKTVKLKWIIERLTLLRKELGKLGDLLQYVNSVSCDDYANLTNAIFDFYFYSTNFKIMGDYETAIDRSDIPWIVTWKNISKYHEKMTNTNVCEYTCDLFKK